MSMIDGFPIKTVIRERVTCPACGSGSVRCNRGAPSGGGLAYYFCRTCLEPFKVLVARANSAERNNNGDAQPTSGDADSSRPAP